MGKGIEIGIASETKAFKQGIDTGIIAPLEDAQKSLQDLGSDKGLDKLEDNLTAAQKASQKLEKETKETADTIEREYRQAYAKVKSSVKDAGGAFEVSAREQTHLRKEAIKEIGNEAKANAAETFSSFDGSASSFVDGIQGTLGGLVSSLGPIGLAVGAAGALGIGLINGALQKSDELSQQFKQDVADLTAELIESGQLGVIPLEHILERLKALAAAADDDGNSLKSLGKLAKSTGTSYKDLADAYAGNTEKLHQLARAGKDHVKTLEDQRDAILSSNDADKSAAIAIQHKIDDQEKINDLLGKADDKARAAAEGAKLFAQAGGPEMQVKLDLISQVDSAYDEAAGSVDDFVDKESGVFDVSAYIASMQAREQALKDYQATLAGSGLSSEARTFLNAQGEEAAATLLAGYKAGSPAQKAELARIWSEAGKTSSGEYTTELTKGIPKKIDGPSVAPKVDAPDTSKLDAFLNKPLTKRVTVDLFTRSGQRIP